MRDRDDDDDGIQCGNMRIFSRIALLMLEYKVVFEVKTEWKSLKIL